MLTLYIEPGSSSMAAHIAMRETGAPFDLRHISFLRKENRAESYLTLNPEGKVPTLVIDGRPLTEVAAILFYLAKRFPEAKLLPANDVEADAQAISWMSFLASTVHPARRHGVDHAREIYHIADRRLGDRVWAIGDYSIVDIHLFRLFWRFRHYLDLKHGDYRALRAHHDRMMLRPAVQETLRVESEIGYNLPAF